MRKNKCIICDTTISNRKTICGLCESQQIKAGKILQSRMVEAERLNQDHNFVEHKENKGD